MPTLMDLLEAGVHYGHKKEKSSPRARQYIYTIRNNIYVIDLEKTVVQLTAAIDYIKKAILDGKIVLFVGTKNQAKESVKKLAQNLKMPYVVERWLGGTLTNFESIRKSLKTLTDLETKIQSPEFTLYTKKERKRIEEKKLKLNLLFDGLREMKKLPDALFIVDTAKESVAVSEARKIGIPIVGICDTNANPDLINIPISANDESEKSIGLILEKLEEGIKEEKEKKKEKKKEEKEISKEDK